MPSFKPEEKKKILIVVCGFFRGMLFRRIHCPPAHTFPVRMFQKMGVGRLKTSFGEEYGLKKNFFEVQ